jgi:hypothetical protein
MNKGKNDIMISLFLVVCVAIGIGLFFLFRNMNGVYVLVLMFLVHQFILVPSLNQKYSKIMGRLPDKKKDPKKYNALVLRSYVPLLNETDIYTPMLEKVTLLLGIPLYLIGILLALPYIGVTALPVVTRYLFGDFLAINLPFYLEVTGISLYLILTIIRGLGFATIAGVVDSEMKECFKMPINNIGVLLRLIVLFMPFVRTFSLVQLNDRLNNLVIVHDSTSMVHKEFLEE